MNKKKRKGKEFWPFVGVPCVCLVILCLFAAATRHPPRTTTSFIAESSHSKSIIHSSHWIWNLSCCCCCCCRCWSFNSRGNEKKKEKTEPPSRRGPSSTRPAPRRRAPGGSVSSWWAPLFLLLILHSIVLFSPLPCCDDTGALTFGMLSLLRHCRCRQK